MRFEVQGMESKMASWFFLLVLLSLMSLPKDWHLVFIFYYIIIISRDCPQTGYLY
jgi:hypothetical protein